MPEVSVDQDGGTPLGDVLATPDLAGALKSEPFRRFLDHIPIAIAVSELMGSEQIAYANPEFEKLTGRPAVDIEGRPWAVLAGQEEATGRTLGDAILDPADRVGVFRIEREPQPPAVVEVYSNLIEGDDGAPAFRLIALVDISARQDADKAELEKLAEEKETQLREIQHRVKNNLQMIVALIRLEGRQVASGSRTANLDRLAGRVEALTLLYASMSPEAATQEVDLGVYLSQIASAVMRSQAIEGITLDLKVDAYPVSVDVAMPTGLVVNELLTNSLKHAFKGRDAGTITLHSTSDGHGCRVTVADDGAGLPPGVTWPERGKLGALIAQSLRENAKAALSVESAPGKGTRVTITFTRENSAPAATPGA